MIRKNVLLRVMLVIGAAGFALTAAAQGPNIYFGLPHRTLGNVFASPSADDNTLILEFGDGSPAENFLVIDPSNGEVVRSTAFGVEIALETVYWPEGKSLLVGAGDVLPQQGLTSAPDPILAVSRSGDYTLISLLRAGSRGLAYSELSWLDDSNSLTDGIVIYDSVENLFQSGQSGAPGALITAGLGVKPGGDRESVKIREMVKGNPDKAGVLDSAIAYAVRFRRPTYVGFPGQPPVLADGLEIYVLDSGTAGDFPLYLSSWGQGPLAVKVKQETINRGGIALRTGLLESIQDEAKGFSSLIRRETNQQGDNTTWFLEYHATLSEVPAIDYRGEFESGWFGNTLSGLYANTDGLILEGSFPSIRLSDNVFVMEFKPDFSRVMDFSQSLNLLLVASSTSSGGNGQAGQEAHEGLLLRDMSITVTQTERYESFQLIYARTGMEIAPGDIQLDSFTIPMSPTTASLVIKTKSSPPKSDGTLEPNPWQLGMTLTVSRGRTSLVFSEPVEVTVPGSQGTFEGTTLSLRGIEKKDIRRGMVIAKPGSITPHGKSATDPTVLITRMETIGASGQPSGSNVTYTTKGGFFEPGQSVCLQVPGDLEQLLTQGGSFQWYKDQTVLPGETGATLCFSNLTEADSGTYRVVVDSPDGAKSQTIYSFYLQVASSVPAYSRHGFLLAALLTAGAGIIAIRYRRNRRVS